MNGEDRVAARHLARAAFVYARQSSPHQLKVHAESTRIQRNLTAVAQGLGWSSATVVDDDLGISAGGFADRPGFQQMLSQVATRKAGILVCFDASRLARNSPDWANLFQLCGQFDTLVADSSQVYDLALPNDRLVLARPQSHRARVRRL
ncbi:MAG: DNA invertase Pin-like site-specific DNA recombinase [Myxococcota bacterium]|jgi:DNA invertase Pin-like site-specific DNA recombinase